MSVLSPVLQPILRPILRSVFDAPSGRSLASQIRALFAEHDGAWYDPSDRATLFQDAAGSIPVTAPGQPVGLVLDKSGHGYHLTQATTTARPTYQIDDDGRPYLRFDGVDDRLVSAARDTESFFDGVAGFIRDTPGVTKYVRGTNGTAGILSVFSSGADEVRAYMPTSRSSYPNQRIRFRAPDVVAGQWIGKTPGVASVKTHGLNSSGPTTISAAGDDERQYWNTSVGGSPTGGYCSALNYYGGIQLAAVLTDDERNLAMSWLARRAGL